MLLPLLDKVSEYLSACLKNNKFVENAGHKYPEVLDNLDSAQEIILELFYKLKDLDADLLVRNIDLAKDVNLEMNNR